MAFAVALAPLIAGAGAAAGAAGTLATIGTVVSAVGTIASVVGAIQGGNAAASAERANARNLETQAQITRQQGGERANRIRSKARALMGEQRARIAETGGVGGTDLALIKDTAAQTELDALTESYNADLEGLGFDQQAVSARRRGASAKKAGFYNAAAALGRGFESYADFASRPTAGGTG